MSSNLIPFSRVFDIQTHFICLRAGYNINIDHPCLWSHMKKQVCELELTFHPFLVTQTTASNNLQQL